MNHPQGVISTARAFARTIGKSGRRVTGYLAELLFGGLRTVVPVSQIQLPLESMVCPCPPAQLPTAPKKDGAGPVQTTKATEPHRLGNPVADYFQPSPLSDFLPRLACTSASIGIRVCGYSDPIGG
jgi:hypothetical protein